MSNDVTIDLTGYKDKIGQRVAPGRYRVLVEDAEKDTAKSGNTMINLWLRVQGGEFDGATIIDRLVMTPNSLFRVVGFMQALGIPTPKKRLQINLKQFIGKSLEVDIDDGEPYNGRVKSEIRGYMKAAKASPANPVSIADLSEPMEAVEVAAEAVTAGIVDEGVMDAPAAPVDLDRLEL